MSTLIGVNNIGLFGGNSSAKKKQEPEPVPEEGRRLQYLGAEGVDRDYSKYAIVTDILPQANTQIDVECMAECGMLSALVVRSGQYNYFYLVQLIADENIFTISSYNVNTSYLTGVETMRGQWKEIHLYGNGKGEILPDNLSIDQPPSSAVNTNGFLTLFDMVGDISSYTRNGYIKCVKVTNENVEHLLVPWGIEDKGYIKDLTTGKLYGSGEGYILGPDYVDEEVGE